jgi:prolyl 4-hydroxylase
MLDVPRKRIAAAGTRRHVRFNVPEENVKIVEDNVKQDTTATTTTAIRRSKRKKKIPNISSVAMKNLFFSQNPKPEQRRCGKLLQLENSFPHIYTIKNFLTETEVQHLDGKYVTHVAKFKRSYTDDGSIESKKQYDENRTSTFTWLKKAGDNTLRNIERRAAEIVGLPCFHVEPFQIVAYKNGQQFKTHHDMGALMPDGTVNAGEPRRLVTFFVYLNTLPFGQGHTEFPLLKNVSITPERGMAVMFPNTMLNGMPDRLTVHKANPVEKPHMKFGMNIW